MALPSDFNEFEHLQAVFRRAINHQVREEFADQTWEDDDPDVSVSRGALRWACTHKDDDSSSMTLMRSLLFYFTLRKGQDLHPAIYGIPVDSYHESVRFKPQITLFFREDMEDVEDGFKPIRSEVSFRLINETAETLTRSEALAKGQRIKQLFGANNGFRWKRGREKIVYRDSSKGYDFRLFAWDKAEGKRVIEQVLDINGHAPDWDYLTVASAEKTFRTIPQSQVVVGRTVKLPRERPVGYVRFRWAELRMWELPHPMILCDLTGYWRNALVAA